MEPVKVWFLPSKPNPPTFTDEVDLRPLLHDSSGELIPVSGEGGGRLIHHASDCVHLDCAVRFDVRVKQNVL